MKVIDIHAHIYEKVAGITQGQPMSSTSQGKVTIGNREIQFLPLPLNAAAVRQKR